MFRRNGSSSSHPNQSRSHSRSSTRMSSSDQESDIHTLQDAGEELMLFGDQNSMASRSMQDMLTTSTTNGEDIVTMPSSSHPDDEPPSSSYIQAVVPPGWAAARPLAGDSASQFPRMLPKTSTGATVDEEEEEENENEPFVYPRHLSPRKVVPPTTILCGRKESAIQQDQSYNNTSLSMWHQRLCGIRADRLIVLLMLILFLAIATIVGALLYSNGKLPFVIPFLSQNSENAATSGGGGASLGDPFGGTNGLPPSAFVPPPVTTSRPTLAPRTLQPTAPLLRASTTTAAPTTAAPVTSVPTSAPTTTTTISGLGCNDPAMQDDLQATFPLSILPDDEYVSCDWVALMLVTEEQTNEDLCQPGSPEFYFCPQSCGNCDATTAIEWPVDACGTDSATATFFVGRFFGTQDCAWLNEFYLTHGERLCANNPTAFQHCRATCRNCGPEMDTVATAATLGPTASPIATTTNAPTPLATTTQPAVVVDSVQDERTVDDGTFPPLNTAATTVPVVAATLVPTNMVTTTTPTVSPVAVTTQPTVPTAMVTGGTSELVFAVSELVVGALPAAAGRLQDPTSDQSVAVQWLANALDNGAYTGYSSLQLLQVYALMTFAIATDVNGWTNQQGWGDPTVSECNWWGVVCGPAGAVTQLDLASNNLVGQLPPEIELLQNSLRILVLSDNTLQGRIPGALGQLYLLEELYMDRNSFTGEIPATIGNLFSLRRWYLERNPGLTGVFPAAIATLPQLDELVFYYTRITELTTDICAPEPPSVLIFDCRQLPENTCWSRCFYLCGGSTGIECAAPGQEPPR